MRVAFLCIKQRTPLKTATSSCRVNLGGKCAQAGMERDWSGLVENLNLPQEKTDSASAFYYITKNFG